MTGKRTALDWRITTEAQRSRETAELRVGAAEMQEEGTTAHRGSDCTRTCRTQIVGGKERTSMLAEVGVVARTKPKTEVEQRIGCAQKSQNRKNGVDTRGAEKFDDRSGTRLTGGEDGEQKSDGARWSVDKEVTTT